MSVVRQDAIPFETLLLEESRYPGFSLGDSSLDALLGDSFGKCSLSLLSGPPGVGKTQFVLSAACWCIAHQRHVLLLTSDRGIVIERILSILHARQIQGMEPLSLLHIETVASLQDVLEKVEHYQSMAEGSWGGILIDSLTPVLQPYLALDMNNGRSMIAHLFLFLRQVAIKCKCPIIVRLLLPHSS